MRKISDGMFVAVALLAVVIAGRASAQSPGKPPAPPTPRTTLGGVYTAAQATAGEEVYLTFCVSCHPTPTYTGESFQQNWVGKPLSELYEWVSERMPKNEPGMLTPKQSIEAIAFILRLNKLPAGKTALAADLAVLRRIRIELKAAGK
jgi:hypothetical protein